MPSPRGSLPAMTMSFELGPENVYVSDGSSPLTEKAHRCAVAVPVAGRSSATGPPPTVHDPVDGWNWLSEMIFRLTSSRGRDDPLVLRSTTTMSFPVAFGAPGVSKMASPLVAELTITRATGAESALLGFCTRMLRFPAEEISLPASVVEQTAAESHSVARAAPSMR